MKTLIYKDYNELSLSTAKLIADIISCKPDALLCFPAGETSIGAFEQLIKMNEAKKVSFRECRIVGLDEWIGLGKMKSENCFSFLKRHFFNHIDIRPENMCFFDGESEDLETECRKTDDFIKESGPIDMMLLGAGMNGHLGLNEPGTSFDNYSHIVDLGDTTKSVGQKYFSQEVKLTRGITLGIKHILESKTVILQLSGKRKATIATRLLNDGISEQLPASVLKAHPNSYLLLDPEAANR